MACSSCPGDPRLVVATEAVVRDAGELRGGEHWILGSWRWDVSASSDDRRMGGSLAGREGAGKAASIVVRKQVGRIVSLHTSLIY